MSDIGGRNTRGKPVAVVIGATSKWQAEGRNTLLAHGKPVDDSELPVGVRWGVGGAIAQKFAKEGFFTVVTTRNAANAAGLAAAIREQGGECAIVELDLVSQDSISSAFATIRRDAGDPEVLVYNAGYLEGRDLPPEKELLEHVPVEMSRHRAARRRARAVPGRPAGLAGDAPEGHGVVLLLEQLEFAARAQAA